MRGLAAGQETFLATSTGTSFTDSGLTNGQAYYYKVFATNAVGTGPVSNEASATPAAVPSAPALSSATPGNAQVLLVWIAPSSDGGASITGYKVYRGTTSGGEVLLATLGSVLTYMDASIINGQTYYYRVSAVNSVGESPLSAEVSAKPATVPSSPMSVQISSGNGTNTVSWGTPEDDGGAVIQNYRIYRSTFSNSETYLATCAGTTYTDIGLINGQIYYYKVRAVTSLGEGALSAEVSGRPMTIPTAPTNLQAVNGNGTITLSWSAPANDGGSAIVSYRIFRGLASGAEVLLAETNGTTFLDSGLQNGLAYYYEISATNIVGESGRSAEAQATPGGAPSIPMDLAAFSGNMKLTLSWQSPAYQGGFPINGYNLYRSTVAGQETLLTTLGNVLSYTDSGLSNGITYYYKITAFNAIGEGSLSGEASGRPATIPTEPINFILTPGNRQMLLRWSAPISDGGATVIAYNIYRADASGAEALVVNVTGDLEYLDSGLTNEKTYYYRISAINQMGEGFLSQERSATTNPQFPTNPQNASAEAADGSVQLSWSPPTSDGGSKIIGYKVYRSYIQGGEVLIATLDNVTAFKDEGLVNGVTLFYEITAFNAGREGLPSKRISALPTGVPGTPIGLSTAHGYRNITLTWSAPATDGGVPVTGYRIYRADGSADPVLIANLAITQHSFIDQDLPQGKVYKYQVSAVNLIGEGEPSAEVSLTLPGPPTSPQQLAGTSEDDKVTLSWTAPQSDNLDAVIGYLVYRGTSVTGLEQISMVAGSRMSYVDTGLVNGMTYYYQVTALNSVGEGASSELVSVVPLGVPSAPTELQSDVNGTDATLSWSAPVENGGMPIRGYTISMTVENDKTPINLGDVGTSNLTFVVKGLRLGQGYHFTVTAYNDVGNGTDSITVLVTISGPKASVSVANGQDLLATMPLVPLLILSSAIWLVSVFAIRNRGWLKPKKMEETIKELEKNDTELVQTVKKLEQSNLVTQNSTNEFQKSLRELERLNR
jgi:fibronectin type 3 domain-containing protein